MRTNVPMLLTQPIKQAAEKVAEERGNVAANAHPVEAVVVERAAHPVTQALEPQDAQRDVQARKHGQEGVGRLLFIVDALERVEAVVLAERVAGVYGF